MTDPVLTTRPLRLIIAALLMVVHGVVIALGGLDGVMTNDLVEFRLVGDVYQFGSLGPLLVLGGIGLVVSGFLAAAQMCIRLVALGIASALAVGTILALSAAGSAWLMLYVLIGGLAYSSRRSFSD